MSWIKRDFSKIQELSKKKQGPIKPGPETMSEEEWWNYVDQLYVRPSTESNVRGITIYFTGGKVKIRNKRDPKYVTESEINQLAEFYERDSELIRSTFRERKIFIGSKKAALEDHKLKEIKRAERKRKREEKLKNESNSTGA